MGGDGEGGGDVGSGGDGDGGGGDGEGSGSTGGSGGSDGGSTWKANAGPMDTAAGTVEVTVMKQHVGSGSTRGVPLVESPPEYPQVYSEPSVASAVKPSALAAMPLQVLPNALVGEASTSPCSPHVVMVPLLLSSAANAWLDATMLAKPELVGAATYPFPGAASFGASMNVLATLPSSVSPAKNEELACKLVNALEEPGSGNILVPYAMLAPAPQMTAVPSLSIPANARSVATTVPGTALAGASSTPIPAKT